MAAIEPLTGKRIAQVQEQRIKKKYAYVMGELANEFPDAEKFRLAKGNLNTYNQAIFRQKKFLPFFPSVFECFYTPQSASGMRMMAIEFPALSKQCLHHRIPTIKEPENEIPAMVKKHMEKGIKITCQFSVETAGKN